jgi:glutamate dehydrogenase
MTTRGVHQYVLGALNKMGLREEEVTKCQTGGPDGDLGSNEILISKDKTIAIIDGSGVLYDPHGLNRAELVRLATTRKTVNDFNAKFLSAEGFLVLCESKTAQVLPDGTK